MANVIWVSPLNGCDICGKEFVNIMYDACVSDRLFGPKQWGNVCHECFLLGGGRLGTGLGQKYELQEQENKKYWVKVAG